MYWVTSPPEGIAGGVVRPQEADRPRYGFDSVHYGNERSGSGPERVSGVIFRITFFNNLIHQN